MLATSLSAHISNSFVYSFFKKKKFLQWVIKRKLSNILSIITHIAQSPGVVEYTDCFSAEG